MPCLLLALSLARPVALPAWVMQPAATATAAPLLQGGIGNFDVCVRVVVGGAIPGVLNNGAQKWYGVRVWIF
jgi:hypothetical protein